MYIRIKIAKLVTYANSMLLGFIGCRLLLHTLSLTAVHVERYD